MQKFTFITSLLIIMACLVACNLGPNAEVQSTQANLIVTSEITVEVTQDDNLENPIPTSTQIVTVVSIDDTSTNYCIPRSDWERYTVTPGDTLTAIAARSNTTVDTLVVGNCLNDANLISPGQVMFIPHSISFDSQSDTASITPIPTPDNLNCQIHFNAQRLSYTDQTYRYLTHHLNAGERYVVTGANEWNYRLQYSSTETIWISKSITETPIGNCTNIPEVPLSYVEMGQILTDICYFIPDISTNITTYVDQAQTRVASSLSAEHYYLVDALGSNQYRLVAGGQLQFPAWVVNSTGHIEGNCDQLPDIDVNTTLNAPLSSYEIPDRAISFSYPSNLELVQLADGMGGFSIGNMPYFGAYPDDMNLPNDVFTISLSYTDFSQAYDSPLDYATSYANTIQQNPSNVILMQSPTSVVLASGLETVHYVLDRSGKNIYAYVFEIDEHFYLLHIEGNPIYAQSFINSLSTTLAAPITNDEEEIPPDEAVCLEHSNLSIGDRFQALDYAYPAYMTTDNQDLLILNEEGFDEGTILELASCTTTGLSWRVEVYFEGEVYYGTVPEYTLEYSKDDTLDTDFMRVYRIESYTP